MNKRKYMNVRRKFGTGWGREGSQDCGRCYKEDYGNRMGVVMAKKKRKQSLSSVASHA